jgi:hypothetical protein
MDESWERKRWLDAQRTRKVWLLYCSLGMVVEVLVTSYQISSEAQLNLCCPQWTLRDTGQESLFVFHVWLNKMFWKELIAYYPLIRHESYRKWRLQQFFVAAGTCLLSRCLATLGKYRDRPTDSSLIRHGSYRKQLSNSSSNIACIRWHGNLFTKPLPRNDTHTDTQTNERDL